MRVQQAFDAMSGGGGVFIPERELERARERIGELEAENTKLKQENTQLKQENQLQSFSQKAKSK